MNNIKMVCIIPARGGSKRLPRKNIIDFCGLPLIAHTIIAARLSKKFCKVIVSTDDQEIAEISKQFGAEIPFMRTADLANDFVTTAEVAIDTIKNLKLETFNATCILQPTSPLRSKDHIVGAFSMMQTDHIENVVSLTKVAHPVEWINPLDRNGGLEEFDKALEGKRSQDYETKYLLNGAIYMISNTLLIESKKLINGIKSKGFIMDQNSSIDIDTEEDLQLARLLHQLSEN